MIRVGMPRKVVKDMDWGERAFCCYVATLALAAMAPVLAMLYRATVWILTHQEAAG